MEQLGIKGPLRILRDIPTILHQYIKKEILLMIKNSKSYLFITMAYFVPDRSITSELIRASRRGVDVRIMLSKHSDVPLVQYASRTFYSRLMRNGIRIYEHIPTFNHQKTIVSDNLYSTVGSANLNSRSFRHDYEINAFIKDRDIALRLKKMFLEDQSRSREIILDRWKKRRLKEKLIEKFCILFKGFI
jgi:cardiolipin synthase